MEKEIKNMQRPKDVPELAPEITPEMIQSTFKVLETEGLVHYMDDGVYLPTEKGWKLLRGNATGKEEITAYGHEKITSRDENCFEITTNKEPKSEDNIVAVRADKGCRDMGSNFKMAVKSANRVTITIEADGVSEVINAYGSPALRLTDANEVVVRKSDFIDGKTVAILADKAANEFSKAFKEAIKSPTAKVKVTLEVK